MGSTVGYRVSQFLHALVARVDERELDNSLDLLTPKARELFRSQSTTDQRHALAVYRDLMEAGHRDPDLLTAALLHDAGKSTASLPVWQRAIIVLMGRAAPRLLARISDGDARSWRRPYVVHATHPQIGARLAREAGCSERVTALIRRHHAAPDTVDDAEIADLLVALQWTDGRN